MKLNKREKLERVGDALLRGAKATGKAIKRYGPRVHHHAKAISSSAMDVMAPRRTKTVVDLTARRKPKRVRKGKGGFYLDYTK